MSFLTRTPALDQHVSIRLNLRAKEISDRVERASERDGENYKDLEGPPMRCLANMFVNHVDTEVITAWLEKQDTVFRGYVPRMVFEILKDNTFE
tara:strand:+ start:2016 stop:2297 length:282 start_codon:yes stop_codon:yes gene_type:complete